MGMDLKRARKSNSVSWASGCNLCQVKLFSHVDCPVKVGMKDQNHLRTKASYMLHSIPVKNDLPPGFESKCAVSQAKVGLSHLPLIQWILPSKFVMNHTWQVAAGEETEEAKAQKSREMRVLEAVYPRVSAIPPNPSVSLDVEGEHYDDTLTPCVSLTPIEEEESPDLPIDPETPESTTVGSQPPTLPQGLLTSGNSNASKCNSPGLQQLASDQPVLGNLPNQNADVIAATSAALTAIMKSTEKGSLVDTSLLIKILSNPKLIQTLINESGTQANVEVAPKNDPVTAPRSTPTIPSAPSSLPKADMERTASGNFFPMPGTVGITLNTIPLQPAIAKLSGLNQPAPSPPLPSPQTNFVMFHSLPNQNQVHPALSAMAQLNRAMAQTQVPPFPFAVKEAPVVKDANYYKNLIMRHGVEQQQIQDPIFAQIGNNHHNHMTNLKMVQNFNTGEMKPKNLKPCMYFKTPKGCRNGVNCTFQHDMSYQFPTGSTLETHSAKRMKLSGEN